LFYRLILTSFVLLFALSSASAGNDDFVPTDAPPPQVQPQPIVSRKPLPEWAEIGTNWTADVISNKLILFTSKHGHATILVSQLESKADPSHSSAYFKDRFKADAVMIRRLSFAEYDNNHFNWTAESLDFNGQATGQVTTEMSIAEQYGLMTERMWYEPGKMWHIAMLSWDPVGPSASPQIKELEAIQRAIMGHTKRENALWKLLLNNAWAYGTSSSEVINGSRRSNSEPLNSPYGNNIIRECQGFKPGTVSPGPRNWDRWRQVNLLPACWIAMKKTGSGIKDFLIDEERRMEPARSHYADTFECEKFRPPPGSNLPTEYYSECKNQALSNASAVEFRDTMVSAASAAKNVYTWCTSQGSVPGLAEAIAHQVFHQIDGFTCLTPELQAEVLCATVMNAMKATAAIGCAVVTGGGCEVALANKLIEIGRDTVDALRIGRLGAGGARLAGKIASGEVRAAQAADIVGGSAASRTASIRLEQSLAKSSGAVAAAARQIIDQEKVASFVEKYRAAMKAGRPKLDAFEAAGLNDAERLEAAKRLVNGGRYLSDRQRRFILAIGQVCQGHGGLSSFASKCAAEKLSLCLSGTNSALFSDSQCHLLMTTSITEQFLEREAEDLATDTARSPFQNRPPPPQSPP
jgi:hypothetical protein